MHEIRKDSEMQSTRQPVSPGAGDPGKRKSAGNRGEVRDYDVPVHLRKSTGIRDGCGEANVHTRSAV